MTYRIRIGSYYGSSSYKSKSGSPLQLRCRKGSCFYKKKKYPWQILTAVIISLQIAIVLNISTNESFSNTFRGNGKSWSLEQYIPVFNGFNQNIWYWTRGSILKNPSFWKEEYLSVRTKSIRPFSPNFWARYVYGNKGNEKGIKNYHVNIRSLANKVAEVKYVIKQHSPHLLGISECELRKPLDENKLKIPGYDILFPRSWRQNDYARVILYVKKSFCYERLEHLEDSNIQSIWIKGGFKNGKRLYFSHIYREHTSTMGSSLAHQRQYLEKMLNQWRLAYDDKQGTNSQNEIHIMGDMNIDASDDRWLNPNYSLVSLSRMVDAECNYLDLNQLVVEPTRHQFNSIQGTMSTSCIDHFYTNVKYRCSDVSVFPFGASDHDIIGYIRYCKDPPQPSRTIRKRSYRSFDPTKFIAELGNVD